MLILKTMPFSSFLELSTEEGRDPGCKDLTSENTIGEEWETPDERMNWMNKGKSE